MLEGVTYSFDVTVNHSLYVEIHEPKGDIVELPNQLVCGDSGSGCVRLLI